MTTLLVPIDGTPVANRAIAAACELADRMGGARLVLLNVQERLDRQFGRSSAAARQQLRAQGERALAQARDYLDRAGRPYDALVVYGRPAEVISRVAAERGCSRIVIGSRGLAGLARVLFGSVAKAVAEQADVPVTVVH
jgi:nucleotide-binding universal stress UspA family protein